MVNKMVGIERTSTRRDWKSICKSLSVEPAGFLIICSAIISHLLFQNIIMFTACRIDLQYPEDTCREIINKVNATYKTEEREIQKVVATLQAKTSVLFGIITVLVVLFVGPWSDANGRKMPLLMSTSGILCYPISMLICFSLLEKMKVSALVLTLLVVGPITITGGGAVFAMSAYSYIADTTSSKNRTVRTGILSAAYRSGSPIGFAIGGLLTRLGVGTVASLLVSIGLGAVGVLIVVLTVKNTTPGKDADNNDEETGDENTPKIVKKKKPAWIRYNPLTKLWQTLAILFKQRKDRKIFLLLIICHISYAAPGSGEYSMLYLFVRERLQWNVSDYGFFSMYNWMMSAAGVILSMYILSRKLKISDPVVGFVAGISQIGGSTFYAFSTTALAMYLASATDLMNGTIGVVVRSMLSKTVAPDEIGKMFSLLGVLESLLPIVMVPMYAMTYKTTVTVFAGAFFLLSAVLTFPAEAIFMYFICRKKTTVAPAMMICAKPAATNKDGLEDGLNVESVKLMPQKIIPDENVGYRK